MRSPDKSGWFFVGFIPRRGPPASCRSRAVRKWSCLFTLIVTPLQRRAIILIRRRSLLITTSNRSAHFGFLAQGWTVAIFRDAQGFPSTVHCHDTRLYTSLNSLVLTTYSGFAFRYF